MDTKTAKNRSPRIELRLTTEDNQAIRDRATQANLSVSEFMRRAALGISIQAKLSPADLDNLRKMGINLNQAAKFANTYQQWPQEIEAIITSIKSILQGK